MKKNIFRGLGLIMFGSLLFAPGVIWADLVPCGKGATACTLCDLIVGFSNLTKYLLGLLVTISIAGLFFAGVMYIISAGDDGMMKSAKDFAKACLMGFVIVLGAWLIVSIALWVVAANFGNIGHSNWYTFSCESVDNNDYNNIDP